MATAEMTRVGMQRYTVVAVCVLALIASLAHAAAVDVASCGTLSSATYNSDTFDLTALTASEGGTRTCLIRSATITGDGLAIAGGDAAAASGPARGSARLLMLDTTITDASIVVSGSVPDNTHLYFNNTLAAMRSSKSIFDFTSMRLLRGATVTIAHTEATWTDAASAGSVVQLTGAADTMADETGIFVVAASATRAVSVVTTVGQKYVIAKDAAVTVDYSNCTNCSEALVNFVNGIILTQNSLLRTTHSVSTSSALLYSGDVAMNKNSLILISESAAPSTYSMHLDYVTNSDGTSVMTFDKLVAKTSVRIGSMPQSTILIAGQWIIDGARVANTPEAYGFPSGSLINFVTDGRSTETGKCAYAYCLPAHNNRKPDSCDCNCAGDANHTPNCLLIVDPVEMIMKGSQSCSSAAKQGCAACVPGADDVCLACTDGYHMQKDGTCEIVTHSSDYSSHALQPLPREASDVSLDNATHCNDPHCAMCLMADAKYICYACDVGYVLTQNMTCTPSFDAAVGVSGLYGAIGALIVLAVVFLS